MKKAEAKLVPSAELKVINQSFLRQNPADTVIEFPDHSVHLLWLANEKFSSDCVFGLVDRKTKALDVVWDFGVGTRCSGPNAELLEKDDVLPFLKSVSPDCSRE